MGRLALQLWGEWLDASWWNPWNLAQVRLRGTCLHSTMCQAPGPLSWCVATSGNPGGWEGDTAEIGQKALPWENEKRIKSPLVESGEQWCPHCSAGLSLHSHLCTKWLGIPCWASSVTPTVCGPHSWNPTFFLLSTGVHCFHLSSYIDFQADVLWQSLHSIYIPFFN